MATRKTLGFCSARDLYVPVLAPDFLEGGKRPSPDDAKAVVCLDYRVRCTGAMCPLFTCLDQPADPFVHGHPSTTA